MAITIGTNAGFVITKPTEDPDGSNATASNRYVLTGDTVPTDYTKITEIGWWCDSATEESNFEVGLYTDNSLYSELLYVSRTNAKGTTAGWKTVSVDWSVTPGTKYWIAVQLDETATTTYNNYTTSGGNGYIYISPATTLADPRGDSSGGSSTKGRYAIYALVEKETQNTTDFFNFI